MERVHYRWVTYSCTMCHSYLSGLLELESSPVFGCVLFAGRVSHVCLCGIHFKCACAAPRNVPALDNWLRLVFASAPYGPFELSEDMTKEARIASVPYALNMTFGCSFGTSGCARCA